MRYIFKIALFFIVVIGLVVGTFARTKIEVSGQASGWGWNGPKYLTRVYRYINGNYVLANTFYVSRDSTVDPACCNESINTRYGTNREAPPGNYWGSPNPEHSTWIQIGDTPGSSTINGPSGVRTYINFHPWGSQTAGCLTLRNSTEYDRFREAVNWQNSLANNDVVVVIKDRYINESCNGNGNCNGNCNYNCQHNFGAFFGYRMPRYITPLTAFIVTLVLTVIILSAFEMTSENSILKQLIVKAKASLSMKYKDL